MSYDSDDNCLVIDEDRSDNETNDLTYQATESISKSEENEVISDNNSLKNNICLDDGDINEDDGGIEGEYEEEGNDNTEILNDSLKTQINDNLNVNCKENESFDDVNNGELNQVEDTFYKNEVNDESEILGGERIQNQEIEMETGDSREFDNDKEIDEGNDKYTNEDGEINDCSVEVTNNKNKIQSEDECEDDEGECEDMEEGEIVDDEVSPEEAKILQLREIKKKDFSIWNDIARQGNQNYNGYMNSYDMFEEYADPYDPEGLEDSLKYGGMYDEGMEEMAIGDRPRHGRVPAQRNREKGRLICKFFREGYCRDSKNCMYSHNAKDSGRTDKLCRFYQRGNCQNGLSCKNLHGEYPCYRYHIQNACSHGDRCKYSHEPLNDYTESLLGTHGTSDDTNSSNAKKKKTLLSNDGTPLINAPSFNDVMEQLNKEDGRTDDIDMRPFLSDDFHKGVYDVPIELKTFFNQGAGGLSAQDLEAYGIATTTSIKVESPKRKPDINDYMLDLSSVDDGLTASDRILKAFQATDSEEERERAENERKEREERETRRKRKRDEYYNNRGHSNEGGKGFSRRDERYSNRGRGYHSRSPRKDDYPGRGRNYDRNYTSPRRGQSPRDYPSPRRHGSPNRYNPQRVYDSSREYGSPRRRTPPRQPSPRRYDVQNRQPSPGRYHSPERRYQSSGYVSPKSYGDQREYDGMRDYGIARNHGIPRDGGYRESFGSPSRYNQDSGYKDDRYQRDNREIRGSRDPRRDYRDARDSREMKDPREIRGDPREIRGDPREIRGDPREIRGDPREIRGDPREIRGDPREIRGDPREIRGDPREIRGDPRGARDSLNRPQNNNMYGEYENRYDDPRYDVSPRDRHFDNRSSPRRDFDPLQSTNEGAIVRTGTSYYDPTRDPRRRKLLDEPSTALKIQPDGSKNENDFDQHDQNIGIRDGPYVNPSLDPRRNKKTLTVEEKDTGDKVPWGGYNPQPSRNPYDDPPMYVPGPPQSGYSL